MTVSSLTRFEMDLSDELVPGVDRKTLVSLADQLSDYGINDVETFNDALFYRSQSIMNPIHEFVEFILNDIEESEIPSWVVVDHDATWECNLRHDFIHIEANGESFFFHNNF